MMKLLTTLLLVEDSPILGVGVFLLFITGCLFCLNKILKLPVEERLDTFGMFLVTIMLAVWAGDKFIAFKRSLLSVEDSKAVFEILMMMFSFILGTKYNKNKSL